MNIKRLLLIPATLLAAAAFSPANALTVTLSDGTNTSTYSGTNSVTVSNVVLGIWTINVQFADSNAPGTAEGAFIHGTTSVRSSAAGFLEITVSDLFTAPLTAGTLTYASGGSGTNTGTITGYGQKIDREQQLVQTADCVRSITGPSCTSSTSHGLLAGSYIMTMFQRIDVTGATRSFSIDSDVYNVPEPGTLALFGLGLMGIGFSARRRAR